MKITTLLLFVSLMTLSARSLAQQTRVNLRVRNVNILEVFEKLEEQTDFGFVFKSDQLDLNKRYNIEKSNATFQDVLNEIFKEAEVNYRIIENNVIIIDREGSKKDQSQQQQVIVNGKVTDAKGEPLPGVNVFEKANPTNGVITGIDGTYSIQVSSAEAVLTFSFIGFDNQEIHVAGRKGLDVTMVEEATGLDEVVVVGYGTSKKANITGSIAAVKSDEITRVPAPNMTASLAGKLPGLIVDQNGGRPGADAASINIRGFNTKGESALLIVDGVERNFNQLDPNEIESITVLKDASAAIYGVRGGSGVILVTTKRGVTGKPVINYNSTFSMTEATRYPEMANYKQYESIAAAHRRGEEWRIFDAYITPERLAGLEDGSIAGTDWIKEVSRNFAPQQQHNLNVRGGNEAIKYFITGGYLDQGSRWKSGDYGFERFNFTANFDAKISERLDISVGIGLRKEKRETSPADGNGDILDMVFAHPAFPTSVPDGSNVVVNSSNATSPVASTTKSIGGYNKKTVNYETGDFGFTYKVPGIDGLTAGGKVAFVQSFDFTKRLETPFTLWAFDGENYVGQQISNAGIVDLSESSYRFNRVLTNWRLDYTKTMGQHNISALVLFETNKTQTKTVNAIGNDVISAATPYLNFSNPDNRDATGFASEVGRTGLVTRLNYNYASKYLLEMVFRVDQSSYFPKESRKGYFPGVSAGWIMSKENFMSGIHFVSNLKLRASYSKLGNDNIGKINDRLYRYSYIEGFQVAPVSGGYVFNNQFQNGIVTLGEPNKYITWQETELYNIGIDLGFFKNQLTLELDGFYRNRTGILAADTQGVGIPTTSGMGVIVENLESRNNRGFEAVIGHKGSKGDFKYNISANFSWAREKFGKTVETEEYDDPDLERINRKEGNWVNRTFGYQFDGFWTQEEIDDLIWRQSNDPDNYVDYGENPNNIRPGDIRVKDYNGDGEIDGRDRVVIGRNSTPEIMFGLNTNVQYKNWDFNMFWQGAANFDQNMNGTERGVLLHASGPRTPYSYLYGKVWTPENAEHAEFPADLDGRFNDALMDKYYVDSKYVRLKNLVIGYTLPEDVVRKVGINKVRLYVSGTNLITIDNMGIYPVDPETNGVNSYPIQRVYSFGVNVEF